MEYTTLNRINGIRQFGRSTSSRRCIFYRYLSLTIEYYNNNDFIFRFTSIQYFAMFALGVKYSSYASFRSIGIIQNPFGRILHVYHNLYVRLEFERFFVFRYNFHYASTRCNFTRRNDKNRKLS